MASTRRPVTTSTAAGKTAGRKAAPKKPSGTGKQADSAARRKRTARTRADAPRTIAVTGSQSGLGLAIRQRLESRGLRVIGVDLKGKGAEVEADLSTPAGRKKAVAGVLEQCGGALHGVVANAGVDAKDAKLTFEVNYYGAVEVLQGLRKALARADRPAAVVTVSHAIAISPGVPVKAVNALLEGDLKGAEKALGRFNPNPYPVSKLALAKWIRREAPGKDWAGSGVTLNGICPGPIQTPMLEHDLADPKKGPIIRAMPQPSGSTPKPEDLAGLFEFMLGPDARYVVGQLLMADGGIESGWRGEDWPRAWDISTARFLLKLFAPRLG
jgi:NAD(P)-dependent dehydrogenase (short-subunit alcohol dehydrogenase family)